ncbi:unnamed protein product [Anisakis simplex]|uniref:MOSC_N domain-containing protein n=1 Tax=Anisakis simplex TaxID=6269 RepID=A0A0M3J9L6_ANISI|nr:unnamed protein product [Anisakis simplex]
MDDRQCPRLVMIHCDIKDGVLTLTAPEHEPIEVHLQKVLDANQIVIIKMYDDLKNAGLDCGQEVGDWLSKVLNEDGPLGLLQYKAGLYSERWSHRGYRWFFGIAPIKEKVSRIF